MKPTGWRLCSRALRALPIPSLTAALCAHAQVQGGVSQSEDEYIPCLAECRAHPGCKGFLYEKSANINDAACGVIGNPCCWLKTSVKSGGTVPASAGAVVYSVTPTSYSKVCSNCPSDGSDIIQVPPRGVSPDAWVPYLMIAASGDYSCPSGCSVIETADDCEKWARARNIGQTGANLPRPHPPAACICYMCMCALHVSAA